MFVLFGVVAEKKRKEDEKSKAQEDSLSSRELPKIQPPQQKGKKEKGAPPPAAQEPTVKEEPNISVSPELHEKLINIVFGTPQELLDASVTGQPSSEVVIPDRLDPKKPFHVKYTQTDGHTIEVYAKPGHGMSEAEAIKAINQEISAFSAIAPMADGITHKGEFIVDESRETRVVHVKDLNGNKWTQFVVPAKITPIEGQAPTVQNAPAEAELSAAERAFWSKPIELKTKNVADFYAGTVFIDGKSFGDSDNAQMNNIMMNALQKSKNKKTVLDFYSKLNNVDNAILADGNFDSEKIANLRTFNASKEEYTKLTSGTGGTSRGVSAYLTTTVFDALENRKDPMEIIRGDFAKMPKVVAVLTPSVEKLIVYYAEFVKEKVRECGCDAEVDDFLKQKQEEKGAVPLTKMEIASNTFYLIVKYEGKIPSNDNPAYYSFVPNGMAKNAEANDADPKTRKMAENIIARHKSRKRSDFRRAFMAHMVEMIAEREKQSLTRLLRDITAYFTVNTATMTCADNGLKLAENAYTDQKTTEDERRKALDKSYALMAMAIEHNRETADTVKVLLDIAKKQSEQGGGRA